MPAYLRPLEGPAAEPELCLVSRNGNERQGFVLGRRPGEVYVHLVNTDKRLDEWVPEADVRLAATQAAEGSGVNGTEPGSSRKRKRGHDGLASDASTPRVGSSGTPMDEDLAAAPHITEEEYDIQHHKQITAKRNFDRVTFGKWQIKTWYFSPYPLTESETEETASPAASGSGRIPGVSRSTIRSHGRTSDLLAGGLQRGGGEKAMLWVCDRCFKYMAEGLSWEAHVKKCGIRHPPGRKVYQRGAHIIWEVDGAKEKLYCQNLSLFGKLFIDIKTLFFDCDNFLFYILTDADSQRDHVLGFFSKEKVSYDDYNLACIVVFPPYQKKGYGMLMIEFSYELSRRSGKVGTPERPLSDLGLRSYLTYWISTLVRFFRRLLSVLPPEMSRLTSAGALPDLSDAFMRSPSRELENGMRKRKKSTKGWDGEEPAGGTLHTAQMNDVSDPIFTTLRTLETFANPDGSATTQVVVRCTLADIARATNLRVEDAAFALSECGLLLRRGEEEVVVSREMVEVVAKERRVKRMCMSHAHVLL
ncbi:acyl-CoA N-acyltransferase [Obba rivulosa]|uniref:histone acetyltransferase n=1 Tax=Obba rivulosa TaxID=1052685 RepID=A0A8E2DJ62_9APHY|nr:acyl-CoA N-acyltransferase [Obba rivulosa]